MINYFIELFKKPQYLWTSLDELAMTGLVVALLIVIAAISIGIWLLVELRKKSKYNKCERERNGNICWHHNDCINCGFYKKKTKKKKGDE